MFLFTNRQPETWASVLPFQAALNACLLKRNSTMLDYTSVPVPLRIIGIQQRTTLDKVHETLGEMWQQWEGNHKANRLPSFTMTIYCVYQYFEDAPDDVLITIGRITATDFPLPSFASQTRKACTKHGAKLKTTSA